MTTKKQQRARLEQKRLRELEEVRLSGLRAQQKDRELRAARDKALAEEAKAEVKRQNEILAAAKMVRIATTKS